MGSDIFKINKNLITLSNDLSFFGRDRIRKSKYFGILFRYPVFNIPKVIFTECSGNQLGYYDPSQNVISIDLSLTSEIRKDDLDNVYLHELSHAVDLHVNKNTLHDSTFSDVCKALGAKEQFAHAKVSINKNHIKSRIDKLLALSSSDFEAEASSALKKAKSLMLSSGLSYLYSDDEDELFGCILENKKTLKAHEKILISFICRITGAFYFLSHYSGNKCIEIYGTMDQVETTMYVYNDLINKTNIECDNLIKSLKNIRCERINRSQIKIGIVKGIISKNSDIEKSVKGTAIELSSIKSQEIYSRLYNIKFTKVGLRSSSSAEQMFGVNAGKKIGVSFSKGSITKQIGFSS